mgnify:CR=1 FL=1
MAELSLKQIIDKLNTEFVGDTRKLVFWYDDTADFAEDIDRIALEHAKIWKLTEHNQFATKLLLERQDTESNYLIYAPFPKPEVQKNHLEDTMLYAKRFYADRASLILAELELDEGLKPLIQQHIKFFGNKERLQRFYALEMERYTESSLLLAMMCVLCRVKSASFEEVLRVVLTAESLQTNPFLEEFSKYDLLGAFWDFCQQNFGYADDQPNLTKLTASFFLTAASCTVQGTFPEVWQRFLTNKPGSVTAFLASLMNNVLYQEAYDRLSDSMMDGLKAEDTLAAYELAALVRCDTFRCIDSFIIRWIASRLLTEDLAAKLRELDLPELCELRSKLHFGASFTAAYRMLAEAYAILTRAVYVEADGFEHCIEQYIQSDYQLDWHYRQFYTAYDALSAPDDFAQLRELVENVYTNEYLGHQLPAWNRALMERGSFRNLPRQIDFYRDKVKYKREKTVVIISDALRYEVGQELFTKLADGARYTAKLDYMLSTLPSYTRLGMSALLPHRQLELTEDGQELVDGVHAIDLATREKILRQEEPASACVAFDAVWNMKKSDLRQIFTGIQVVYIYHDQIDNAGENAPDSVFAACSTTITEIKDLIYRLAINANTQHFIVTADHGFIYKRDKVDESGKIAGVTDKKKIVKRRYIIADQAVEDMGICHLPLGDSLHNEDARVVSFPLSYNVFKTPGSGGLNYVHGGSSPQELLVPVIEVYAAKGHAETHPVEIAMVTILYKVTSLVTVMEFVQSEPVTDVAKAVEYALYFEDSAGELITGVIQHVADSRDMNTANRIFKVKFSFKNQTYSKAEKYYLVIRNEDTGLELRRHEVMMDVAFAGDLG